MVFPWQSEQWQQLLRAKQENRLPHALLFVGIKGTGKAHFAESFIRAQLCSTNSANCECHACRLIAGRTHPNVLWIEPEKEGGAIKIDQVREAADFVNHTSLQGEYRFVVICPANNMNANAANALLKTLEEPSSGTILILISEQTSHLPATILSRCQHIYFPQPKSALALEWLTKNLSSGLCLPREGGDPSKIDSRSLSSHIHPELILRIANGAPLAALQLVQDNLLSARLNLFQILYALTQKQTDPIKSAASIKDMELLQILDFTLSLIIDLLRLHFQGSVINKDFITQLTDLRQRTLSASVIQYMDYLQQLRSQICQGINLNKQLMIENSFIRWMECVNVSR